MPALLRPFVLLAATLALSVSCASVSPRKVEGVTTPFHTEGARIISANGKEVRLISANWFGAESSEFVVGGLDRQRLSNIVSLIREAGFNSVRLPWSNELVARDPIVDAQYLAANRALQGKTGLEIFDAVIDEVGAQGMFVILDN